MRVSTLALAALAAALILGASTAARAAPVDAVLPPYDQTADGIPLAFWFDDFVSYQGDLLDQLQTAGHLSSDWGDFSGTGTGTGNLDVIVYTGAGGVDNDPVSGGFTFEDPIPSPSGGTDHLTSNNWWGQNDIDNDGTTDGRNGPVTVGTVLDYLHQFQPLNNTPVFAFDNNAAVGQPGIQSAAGWAFVKNPTTGEIVASWAFDSLNGPIDGNIPPTDAGPGNDSFDEPGDLPTDTTAPYDDDPWVPAPNTLEFLGTSGTTYTVNNNRGSGTNDFYVYAPSMDLSAYDRSYIFGGQFFLGGLTNGFDELYLTGRVTPYVIPEPTTMALGLVALGGLGAAGWRRRKKA